MRHTLWAAAAALALAGCGVSAQVVAEKDAALDACEGSLSACEAQAKAQQAEVERLGAALAETRAQAESATKEREALGQKAQASAADQAHVQQQLDASQQQLKATRDAALALEQQEAALRQKLEQELRACTVEIERLQGQLRVRTLEQVLFAQGSADILPAGQAVLDAIAASLAGSLGQVRVEGHTDELPIAGRLKGKYFSNWELSAARAASVVRYFQYAHQIEPQRLTVVGRAAFQPVAPNDSAANRARNRRVEVVLGGAQ